MKFDSSSLSPRSRGIILRNLAEFQTELFRVFAGFIPAMSRWELKRESAEVVFRDACAVEGFRRRCVELRVGLPDPFPSRRIAGRQVIETLCGAEDGAAVFLLIFKAVKPGLCDLLRAYRENSAGIFDAPSLLVVEASLVETERQLAWAKKQPEWGDRSSPRLQDEVAGAFAVFADRIAEVPGCGAPLERGGRNLGNLPFFQSVIPPDFVSLDGGISLKGSTDYSERAFSRALNFLQEIQAAETCASLLFEVPDMPWEFYRDLSRHMWDEMRHCEFGERKLRELGQDVREAGVSNSAYVLRQTLKPADRYAALTTQEADAFPGKQEGLKDSIENGDVLLAQAWSYDIADETQHVRYGQKWLPALLKAMEDPRDCEQVRRDAENWRRDVLGAGYRPAAHSFEQNRE